LAVGESHLCDVTAHARTNIDILGGFEPTIVSVFVDQGPLFRMRDRDLGRRGWWWRWFLRASNGYRYDKASDHDLRYPHRSASLRGDITKIHVIPHIVEALISARRLSHC
jgi:hypothetical protein